MSYALKILSDTGSSVRVGGYGVVFGGQDLTGDVFTKATDFWFDRISATPPVLYQHGQDDTLKRSVVGRVQSTQTDDVGLWVEAQLTASKQYLDAIRHLVKQGVLGWSSGSVPHLVARVKATGGRTEITSWPIVELSLTPTPAEPRTIGVHELKSLAMIDPWLEDIADAEEKAAVEETKPYRITTRDGKFCVVGPDGTERGCHDTRAEALAQQRALYANESKATLDTAGRNSLSGSDFAYVDSSGGRHLPINDEGHVRAAMGRFNQTHFESPAKKRSAARKILARARSLGIEVADDSAVAMAAKGGLSLDDATEQGEPLVGSAAKVAELGNRLLELAEAMQGDLKAMQRFGIDTKDGHRMHEATRLATELVRSELDHELEWAKSIDAGEDGIRRVNYHKHKLALIALEASA